MFRINVGPLKILIKIHSIDAFSRENEDLRRKKRRSAPRSEILIVKVDYSG